MSIRSGCKVELQSLSTLEASALKASLKDSKPNASGHKRCPKCIANFASCTSAVLPRNAHVPVKLPYWSSKRIQWGCPNFGFSYYVPQITANNMEIPRDGFFLTPPALGSSSGLRLPGHCRVAAKELNLSNYIWEAVLITIYTHYGNATKVP